MDQSVVESYLKEVPSVLINATKPLGDEKCWAVYITLLKEDGLRFNKIKEIYDAQPAEISRVLKALANAGLIAKQARAIDDIGNTEASYYTPTSLGKSLITSLYRGLLPASPLMKGSGLVAMPKFNQDMLIRSRLQPAELGRMKITNVGGISYEKISTSKRGIELHAK